jgi:glycosyltransferase involved in cell wall biosynthesis
MKATRLAKSELHNQEIDASESCGKDENPLISLILLCYNHEKFVAEAINGVFAQTYSPLEILIIDDCSPDRTAEVIAAKLAAHRAGSKIPFIRNPQNMGGKASVELGLSRTTADFIFILSGDDIMLPEMVTEMAKVWINERVSLVAANAILIDDNSKPLGRTFRDPNTPGDDSFETLARDGGNACCFAPAMGFEREIYTTFGWPPLYLGTYDIMLTFCAYLLKGARYIEKPLVQYRVHGGNTSLSLIEERGDEMRKLLTQERMHFGHLAHALLMQEELRRLKNEQAERYAELADRVAPLVTVQITEMGRRLVNTRIALQRLGTSLDPGHFGILPKTDT